MALLHPNALSYINRCYECGGLLRVHVRCMDCHHSEAFPPPPPYTLHQVLGSRQFSCAPAGEAVRYIDQASMIQSDTGASLHDQSQQALLAAINHIQSHLQDLVSAVVQGSSDPNRHRSRQSSLSLHSAAEYGNYYTGGSRTGSSISLVDTESTPLSPPPASGNDLSSSSRLEQRLDISQDLSLLVSALERIHITLSSPQFVGSVDGSEDNNNDDYHSRRSDATGQDAHRFDNTMTCFSYAGDAVDGHAYNIAGAPAAAYTAPNSATTTTPRPPPPPLPPVTQWWDFLPTRPESGVLSCAHYEVDREDNGSLTDELASSGVLNPRIGIPHTTPTPWYSPALAYNDDSSSPCIPDNESEPDLYYLPPPPQSLYSVSPLPSPLRPSPEYVYAGSPHLPAHPWSSSSLPAPLPHQQQQQRRRPRRCGAAPSIISSISSSSNPYTPLVDYDYYDYQEDGDLPSLLQSSPSILAQSPQSTLSPPVFYSTIPSHSGAGRHRDPPDDIDGSSAFTTTDLCASWSSINSQAPPHLPSSSDTRRNPAFSRSPLYSATGSEGRHRNWRLSSESADADVWFGSGY